MNTSLHTFVSGAMVAGLFAASSASAAVGIIYSETFDSASNTSLSNLGWVGYGFAGASTTGAEISAVSSNTLFIGSGISSPNTGQGGYLAAILGNPDGGNPYRYPTYIAQDRGLDLDFAGATISWAMNGASGATVRVRLLVEIDGELYASAVSDTAQKYFSPAAFGDANHFQNNTELLTKTLSFTTDADAWEKLTYDVATGSVSFTALSSDLPSTKVTSIGFHITGGNTGRIDTLQVVGTMIPEPSSATAAFGLVALGFSLRRFRRLS